MVGVAGPKTSQAFTENSPLLVDCLAALTGYDNQVSALLRVLEGVVERFPRILDTTLQKTEEKLGGLKTPPYIEKQRSGLIFRLEEIHPKIAPGVYKVVQGGRDPAVSLKLGGVEPKTVLMDEARDIPDEDGVIHAFGVEDAAKKIAGVVNKNANAFTGAGAQGVTFISEETPSDVDNCSGCEPTETAKAKK